VKSVTTPITSIFGFESGPLPCRYGHREGCGRQYLFHKRLVDNCCGGAGRASRPESRSRNLSRDNPDPQGCEESGVTAFRLTSARWRFADRFEWSWGCSSFHRSITEVRQGRRLGALGSADLVVNAANQLFLRTASTVLRGSESDETRLTCRIQPFFSIARQGFVQQRRCDDKDQREGDLSVTMAFRNRAPPKPAPPRAPAERRSAICAGMERRGEAARTPAATSAGMRKAKAQVYRRSQSVGRAPRGRKAMRVLMRPGHAPKRSSGKREQELSASSCARSGRRSAQSQPVLSAAASRPAREKRPATFKQARPNRTAGGSQRTHNVARGSAADRNGLSVGVPQLSRRETRAALRRNSRKSRLRVSSVEHCLEPRLQPGLAWGRKALRRDIAPSAYGDRTSSACADPTDYNMGMAAPNGHGIQTREPRPTSMPRKSRRQRRRRSWC